jgi:hypothetical protein
MRNKSVLTLAITFLAGLVAGHFVGSIDMLGLGLSDRQLAKEMQIIDKPIDNLTNSETPLATSVERKDSPARTANLQKVETKYRKFLPDFSSPEELPPHLTDPAFYFTPGSDEVEMETQRQAAVDELIRSMQEAGLPEEDIQSLVETIDEAVSEKKNRLAPPDSAETEGYEPSLEEMADDLIASHSEAGATEEEIEAAVDVLWESADEKPEQIFNIDEELVHNPDQEVLDHEAPDHEALNHEALDRE